MYLTQIGGDSREGPGPRVARADRHLSEPGENADGLARAWTPGAMEGRSLAMQRLFGRMKCTAPHFRVAAVEGEPGTGKMLTAETLHRLGPAAEGPFAPYPAQEFLERPEALWNENRGGLLYLAGVDELPPERQRQLRDFLARTAHERVRTRAGSGPLQLVAGSAQPLRRLAAAGTFRTDLASHLTAIRFPVPPLRERREDIPLLASVFLERWSRKHGKPLRGFLPGALESLSGYAWPGNVRELESAVSAAALECTGQWIRPVDFPRLEWPAPMLAATREGAEPQDPNLDRAILRHIVRVLAQAGGNKVRAARMLGISRSTLYRLLDPAAPEMPGAGDP